MEICESKVYEGKIFTMGDRKPKKKKIKEILFYPIMVAVLAQVIFTVIIFLCGKVSGFLSLPETVKRIDERVLALENKKNNQIEKDTQKSTTIETKPDGTATITITGKSNIPVKIVEGREELECRLANPSNILENMFDRETGQKYTPKQLIDKKVLISFTDGNYENLFYGQFNEDDHWDGKCITNIYKDDKLFFIMEAEYNDGNISSYKQALKSKTSLKMDVWSIAERECVIDQETKKVYNTGETWNYFYINSKKQFETDNVNSSDIKYVGEFKEELQEFSSLEGYYHGNTSGGLYNDNTGDAYMLKYSEEGIIRALYVGIFEKGYLNDESNNAWEIVFDESNNINRYFYYKGKFSEGKRLGSVDKEDYITQKDIDKYTQGMIFNCEMNWYDSDNKEPNF